MFTILLIIFYILGQTCNANRYENLMQLPETTMTTPEIVEFYGYPIEIIESVTTDGYILTLHRIPFGLSAKGRAKNVDKPVVFLQHGLIASSADWVTNLPNQSAGFVFADAGFDVWMGNVRGNVYSNRHRNYSTKSSEFWKFSWDEMSQFDLSAMIDTVLKTTEQPSLYYIGHSQGTEIMFAKLSADAEFSKKIRKFFALAPVGTVGSIRGALSELAFLFGNNLERFLTLFGPRDFLPHSTITQLLARLICGLKYTNPLCDNFLFQIGGPESNQFNNSRLLVYMSHTPAGTSTFNIIHWIQMNLSKKVQKYDYGSEAKNLEHYGQPTPPIYNYSTISVPTYLYYSPSDWLADDIDVKSSLIDIIDKQFLKKIKPLEDFNHFDFIWGLRARNEIYDEIVKTIRQHYFVRHFD